MTEGWQRLMTAPWGKHTPEAIEAKRNALLQYDADTERFWDRRNAAVPTFQRDIRPAPVAIESWVPHLAPAFAQFKGDVRAIGRL